MSYTETELNDALKQAEAKGEGNLANNIRDRIAALKGSGTQTPKMPMMDAYLRKCVARCRPKGGQ